MKSLRLTTLTVASLLLHWGTPTRVAAQLSTFETGTIYTIPGIATSTTTGRSMEGMQVSWTLQDGTTGSGIWGPITGPSGPAFGVTGGIWLYMDPDANTFSAEWGLRGSRSNRVHSLTLNGAPGRTLFDCAWTGTACTGPGQPAGANFTGTPGSATGLSAQNSGSSRNAIFRYSNVVQIGSAPPVGDLFEQLTIDFTGGQSNVLGAEFYYFRVDTDNSVLDQPLPTVAAATTTVPEPGSLVLVTMGLGGLGIVSRHRRRRTAFAS